MGDAEPTWAFYSPPSHIEVRGVDVAYRRRGQGPPVLYLHGIGMTRRWLPLYEELSRSCDLVVPEHPGLGETPAPGWLEGFDDLVLHYAEFADLLGLESFHLVGYSFGGWIAAELAAFYPERLRSLTLIAPLGLRVPGHTPTDIYRMSHERFADLILNGRADAYRDYVADGDEMETLFQSYAELTAVAKIAWNPRYDHKLDRRLGRVSCPVLLIAAEEDRILPRAHIERYAELLSGARIAAISGTNGPTGHGLVAQEPELLAQAIAEMWEEG